MVRIIELCQPVSFSITQSKNACKIKALRTPTVQAVSNNFIRFHPRLGHRLGQLLSQNETENAAIAQAVERVLGKDEVSGSIPDSSSIGNSLQTLCLRVLFFRMQIYGGYMQKSIYTVGLETAGRIDIKQ